MIVQCMIVLQSVGLLVCSSH